MTDDTVKFEVQAYIRSAFSPTGMDYPLPVLSVVVSEDMDRNNFVEVRLTTEWLEDIYIDAIDPRYLNLNTDGPVRVHVLEKDYVSSSAYTELPDPALGVAAYLWPRVITRDFLARTVSIILTSGEPFLDEKLKLSAGATNTGAINVAQLVAYALAGAMPPSSVTHASITVSTTIPSGDRRNMESGDSFAALIDSELAAINCRLYDYWGLGWFTEDRDTASGAAIDLATAPGLQPGVDAIVWDLKEERTREDRFADGVIVEYDRTQYGGTVTRQFSGTGTSTKGMTITRTRPEPAGNAADAIKARSETRGQNLTVIARASLDVRTRRPFVVWTKDTYIEGTIRAVEWSFPEGEMRLRVQS